MVGGGAWPFLVGGVICLVNSGNERDSGLLNSRRAFWCMGPVRHSLLRGMSSEYSCRRLSNNRSVMPLDVLGRTRATLNGLAGFPSPRGAGNRVKTIRDRDWGLQLFPMNEEFPVSASHQLALIKSLPFVHTARRYYRLNDLVRPSDWRSWMPEGPECGNTPPAGSSRRLELTERCPNLII